MLLLAHSNLPTWDEVLGVHRNLILVIQKRVQKQGLSNPANDITRVHEEVIGCVEEEVSDLEKSGK